MEGLGDFICRDCNMAFHSAGLLDKHKAKFCIGTDLKEPIALWKGQRKFAREREKAAVKTVLPTRAKTPDLIILKEERNHKVDQRESEQNKPQDGLSEKTTLNKLTEEFKNLRVSVEQSMQRNHTEVLQKQLSSYHSADVQRTLDFQKDHERRLAEIRAHNQQLEKERQEIEQRLLELTGREKTAHLEEVLQELRSQELRNEEVLHRLSSHINSVNGPNPNEAPSNPSEDRKTQHVTFDLISSVDGPLSAQIRALRLAYVQSGGSDAEVLAHMHDLQEEALKLERERSRAEDKNRTRRMKSPPRVLDSDVLAVEQENQRLEEEIFRMRLARERHKGEHGFTDLNKDHFHQMASLQAEITFLMREIEKGRERRAAHPQPPLPDFPESSRALTPPALPLDESSKHNLLMGSHLSDPMESLAPALYDPAAGFVIFYDLVIGIEATLRSVRLLAGLYCNGQKLGQTTLMTPVQCQPAGPSLPSKSPGNYAILAVKQPVLSVQPSPDLSLVMEIQASRGLDLHKNKMEGLVTCGWTKFELFDQNNQTHSGYWRIPFRSLPVQESLSADHLSSVPLLGNMELCLRVANACDGDVQTLVQIDPNATSQYKYISRVVSNTTANQKPNHTSSQLPSSLPQMDHVEEPNLCESKTQSKS